MLSVTASVAPEAKQKEVRIRYIVGSAGVTFTDAPDEKKRAVLDFLAVAYDAKDREVQRVSDTLDATIPWAVMNVVVRSGLPAHQELALPPGTYTLRLGVLDRESGALGTVTVPKLVVE
jgi:hypothetical protein